jgi:branched-chain amino acid transport system ATP-binding protein
MARLDIVDVSVRFGGLVAVDAANLSVESGAIIGLIGPNGAGKTTLFNVITGLQLPSGGRVSFDGRDLGRAKPYRRARLGIARTFQRLEAFGSLTVRENVLVAAEMRKRWATTRFDAASETDEILNRVGIGGLADRRCEDLPTGNARLVELARALAVAPSILLLDEPSSGLDEAETDMLGELLLELSREGLGVLLVEHDMPLVMNTCGYIHVLDFGRIIAQGTPVDIQGDSEVQRAYLGSKASLS